MHAGTGKRAGEIREIPGEFEGRVWDVEEMNKEPWIRLRGRHATHAKRMSTQVVCEFSAPGSYGNDSRLVRKARVGSQTRNETLLIVSVFL